MPSLVWCLACSMWVAFNKQEFLSRSEAHFFHDFRCRKLNPRKERKRDAEKAHLQEADLAFNSFTMPYPKH